MLIEMKPSKQFELLTKWALSLLEPTAFYLSIVDDDYLEIVLGKTTYNDMLLFDYFDKQDVNKSRKVLTEYLISNFNELFQRYEVAFILDRMIDDSEQLPSGLRRLSNMAAFGGFDFIPNIFIGLDSETDSVPIDVYREEIIKEAKKLRQVLKEYGI